jgi:chitodextrinase
MKICHPKNRSIQLFGVFQERLMFIPVLLKKRLFLSHQIRQIVLIFAIIVFLAACKVSSSSFSSPDNQPPTTPENLIVEAISPAKIHVDWEASTDNERVRGYKIYRDGLYISSILYGYSSYSDSGLNPDTKYCYTVSAYDRSQNESPQSQSSCATTPLDLTPPTSPAGLIARAVSSDQIDLKWTASTDDVIVSGYKIFRNGSLILNITETRFSDTGLNPATSYCYTVSAYDTAGNESDSSGQACAVSSWIITTIGHLSEPPSPAIAIDSSNYAHVVFVEKIFTGPNSWISNLLYATNTTESWVVEPIGIQGGVTSLALDSADRVHISFFYPINRLNYATNASGVWATENFDTVAYSHPIAIDSADNVHMICATSFGPKHFTNASGTWTEEILETSANINSNSMAVDLYDNLHISFFDLNGDLKYITNASGVWITETVDSQGDLGPSNSIAVDSAGNVSISYYDRTNADLKYATNASGVWITETVDSQGDLGKYTSIAVDSAGNAHISYYDSTNESLNYTTNASGEWERYTLDSWSEFVREQDSTWGYGISSIALDSTDKVHIVYDWMNDVRYITNR